MSNLESPSPALSSLSAAQLPAVCILGLGLIDGFTIRDLRAHNAECLDWNRSSTTVEEATKEGFNASTNPQATLECTEVNRAFIVAGTSMTTVGIMLDAINRHAPSCGITDVISVKAAVAAEVSVRGMEERFISAHPTAGPVQTGWSAVLEGLFDGAPWVITYDLAAAADAAGKPVPERWIEVSSQIASLGAALDSQLIPTLGDYHDISVARIFHMPHLAVYVIAIVGGANGPPAIPSVAGSFRDRTRVAAAAPDMVMFWYKGSIEPVLAAFDDMIGRLTAVRAQLTTGGIAMDLARIDQITCARYETHPAHRPIFRPHVGEGDWINQLRLVGSVDGQVDVSQCGTMFSPELYASLAGITVADLIINVLGPLAAQYLGRLGVRAIKVEPPADDPLGAFDRPWYEAMSVGHEIIQADLKSDEGRAQLSSLINEADVTITSVRPSALERVGLAGLHERPNDPVHTDTVSDTDASETPDHDLAYQAETGALTPPTMPPVLLGDVLGAHLAVTTTLAGLIKRAGAGVDVIKRPGLHCRIGLKQTDEAGAASLEYGVTIPGGLLGGGLWTYGLYLSADGYVTVAAPEPHFAAALIGATGASSREELVAFLGEHTNTEIMQLASGKALSLAVME